VLGKEVDERGYGVQTESVVGEIDGVKFGEGKKRGDKVGERGRDF
jgi:hypothetical protein